MKLIVPGVKVDGGIGTNTTQPCDVEIAEPSGGGGGGCYYCPDQVLGQRVELCAVMGLLKI